MVMVRDINCGYGMVDLVEVKERLWLRSIKDGALIVGL